MAVHLSTHKEKEPDPSDLDSLALIIVRFFNNKSAAEIILQHPCFMVLLYTHCGRCQTKNEMNREVRLAGSHGPDVRLLVPSNFLFHPFHHQTAKH